MVLKLNSKKTKRSNSSWTTLERWTAFPTTSNLTSTLKLLAKLSKTMKLELRSKSKRLLLRSWTTKISSTITNGTAYLRLSRLISINRLRPKSILFNRFCQLKLKPPPKLLMQPPKLPMPRSTPLTPSSVPSMPRLVLLMKRYMLLRLRWMLSLSSFPRNKSEPHLVQFD